MKSKNQKNAEPAVSREEGAGDVPVGTAVDGGLDQFVRMTDESMVEDRLFALYLARVATIDRYRVPITDKGFPTTLRKAFDEAVVANDVFVEKMKERK